MLYTNLLLSSPAPAASPTATGTPGSHAFPVGNYTLNTILENVSTDCTSNATAWSCAPYHTYADSPSQSEATWDWIINPSPSSPSSFTISTTPNIFNIIFANVSLELLDENLLTERYHFSTPFQKVVTPSDALNVRCNYNSSTIEADLYTRLKQVTNGTSYTGTIPPLPSNTATSSSGGDQMWPYAVEITLLQEGGPDVPDCHQLKNGVLGPRLTQGIQTKATTNTCSCSYKNFNL